MAPAARTLRSRRRPAATRCRCRTALRYAAPAISGIRNGLPQPPHTIGAWARTEGTTRTLRPQSQTALTRTPPPEEPCRAAGPRKVRAVSAAVAAVCALRARWSRSMVGPVATLGLGVERHQREAAAGVRLLGVVQAQSPRRSRGICGCGSGRRARCRGRRGRRRCRGLPRAAVVRRRARDRRRTTTLRSGTLARQDRAARGGAAECRPTPLPALRREQVVSCSRNDNEPGCPGVPIPGHPK